MAKKILVIQFKYFGDVVLMVPALRALRQHWPDGQLHVLVPEETLPLLQYLPWIDKVWAMPRTRGRARFFDSWPMIRALRRERFDLAVDIGGNDRGALLTRLSGAQQRLGRLRTKRFHWRQLCYSQIAMPSKTARHQTERLVSLLAAWGVPAPGSMALEVHADAALEDFARRLVPGHPVFFHVAAGKPKKEWPVTHWAELYRRAKAAGMDVLFTSGPGAREQALLDEVKKLVPEAKTLPPLANLAEFLAVLKRAGVFVSGDTGPLHFAAGLGVPTISLFGPSQSRLWAPLGAAHQFVEGICTCVRSAEICTGRQPCMAGIPPEKVFELLLARR